jgi:5-methyltetrahydropteroyltriglutamate--homocysteine methyltransferase
MNQRTTPPFRADHVGSLLRPVALKKAREARAKGEIGAAELKAVEDREIKDVIKKQEAAGLRSITDGEFRRSWWHLDFLWGLDGVERHVMDTGVTFAAVTTRNEGVKVTGKLGFSGHPMIEHFKFVKANTSRTPKMTIPAPSALYGRPVSTPIDKSVYPKLDKFFDDLGQAYRKAVRSFADAGCRYLQLDEVFIAMLCDPKYRQQMKDRGDDPQALGTIYGDLINIAIADIPPDMTVTMHLCRGNYKSTFMGTGGYDAMQEVLFDRINTIPRAPAALSRWRACRKAAPRCSDWSRPRTARWKVKTRSNGASRRPPVSPISISFVSRRNAASPRPRKAIFSPRTSNGRSCA